MPPNSCAKASGLAPQAVRRLRDGLGDTYAQHSWRLVDSPEDPRPHDLTLAGTPKSTAKAVRRLRLSGIDYAWRILIQFQPLSLLFDLSAP